MPTDSDRDGLSADLRRVASGDRSALRSLYDATGPKLFGVVLRILKDRSEAEDVLQDVYVSVWTKAGSFDGRRGSPMSWLATLARNRAIDRARQLGRRRAGDIDEAASVPDDREDGLGAVLRGESTNRLNGCIDALAEPQARALRTAFFDGLTYEEVALQFGIPSGTMKTWIRRSLMKLKACLAE